MPAAPRPTWIFTDSPFLTATEKHRIVNAWQRFLKGGMKWTQFTTALYGHLIQHASFIAHYDRQGFYRTYFHEGETRIRFLQQFITGESAEYGDRHWLHGEYADINQALCDVARPLAPRLIEQAQAMQRAADLAMADRLLAKHGQQRLNATGAT